MMPAMLAMLSATDPPDPARGNQKVPLRWHTTAWTATWSGGLEMPWQADMPPSPVSGPGDVTGSMWMPSQPPTPERVLAWHLQPIPVMPLICLILLVIYGASLVALYRRG